MGAGASVVIQGANDRTTNGGAYVTDHALHVKVIAGGGGGPTANVNIAAVGGVAVGATVPVSGTVSVTEPVSVDDNGGSLTVDTDGGPLDVSGSVVDVGNFPAVQTIDGNLDVTVTENDAAATDPDLIPVAATRDDVLSALPEAEGDWIRLRVDANGALWVRESKVITPFTGGTADGRPIPIASTGSPGTTIHTVPANTKQRVFMSASNVSANGIRITIRFGGNAAVTDNRDYFIPPNDSRTIINGDILQADGSTRIIYGSSPTANIVNLTGWVESI